ncbi:MAG: hypothetical protein M0P31_07495 [Solirubrobacteraceae bacterium]|nr:hypothetical protein [Solirubrobacteraceae bacterium]
MAIPLVAGVAFAGATGTFAAAGDNTATSEAPTGSPTEAARSIGFVRHVEAQGRPGDAGLPTLPAGVGGENPLVGQASELEGGPVWLSVSGDRLCVYFTPRGAVAPGGGCSDAEIAQREGFTTSTVYSDHDVAFAGIVPDGVERVAIALHDGTVTRAQVENNVYAATLESLPETVTFTNVDGDVVEQPQFATPTLDPSR